MWLAGSAGSLQDVEERSGHDLDYCRRRHVAIASVIAMGTRIVVLDEPQADMPHSARR